MSELPHDIIPEANAKAPDALFAILYNELRQIAHREMRQNGALTLSATTLLHEAYVSMRRRSGKTFDDHAHFLAYSSRVMRVWLSISRAGARHKSGAARSKSRSFPPSYPEQPVDATELERLGVAIDGLAALDPKLAELTRIALDPRAASAECPPDYVP